MKIIRIAYTPDQNRKKIDSNESLTKELKKELKKTQTEVKELKKQIDSLNMGQRRYWQQKTTFTSLQRKIERFEKLEQEWMKYKTEMESKMKSLVEKSTRAQIGKLGK